MREIDFPPANHRKRQACKLSASKNGWFLFCLQKRVYVCPRCSVYHWLIRNSVQILDCFYKSINSYKPCFISSSSSKSPEPTLSLMVIVQIIVIFVFGICTLMLAVIFKCWNSQKVSLWLDWLEFQPTSGFETRDRIEGALWCVITSSNDRADEATHIYIIPSLQHDTDRKDAATHITRNIILVIVHQHRFYPSK